MDFLHQLEIVVILAIQSLGGWLAEPIRLISILGYEEFYMLVMPSLYWCFDSVLGVRMAIMLLLSNASNAVFKLAFQTPRPYWLDTRVVGYTTETSFGIPSGHAQNAASIWGLMAASTRQKWEKIGWIALVFIIGFSRLYLGVHFITDVLAGWLVGGLLLWLFLKLERALWPWLRTRSLNQMLGLAFASAGLIGLVILLPGLALSAWQIPADWQQNALLADAENILAPVHLDGAFTLSGTWLGMMAGVAWLYHRQGGFDTSGTPQQRLLRYLIGVAGILIFWFVLGRVFPRNADAISYALRFARYTLIGLWISALAPLLFERLGLTTAPAKVSPLSSRENPL